jgi:hypothetical protein
MYLGTVHEGAITYRVATLEKPGLVGQAALAAQQTPPAQPVVPYARVGEDGVSYAGPARPDVPRGPIRVVVFGPNAKLVAESAEITAMIAAAAIEGRRWELISVASDQNWGAASTELVHALWDEHALAIIALDRDAAHLSEQLALKAFVPVVALSDDKTLTSTNVPWIFRMPSETTPAFALRLVEAAEVRSGANPERLRGALASGVEIAGSAFSSTGEPLMK